MRWFFFSYSIVAIAILVGTQLTASFPRSLPATEVESSFLDIVRADCSEELREIIRLRDNLAWWKAFAVGLAALAAGFALFALVALSTCFIVPPCCCRRVGREPEKTTDVPRLKIEVLPDFVITPSRRRAIVDKE